MCIEASKKDDKSSKKALTETNDFSGGGLWDSDPRPHNSSGKTWQPFINHNFLLSYRD